MLISLDELKKKKDKEKKENEKSNVVTMASLAQQRAEREAQTLEFNTVLHDVNGMDITFEHVISFMEFTEVIDTLKCSRLNMYRRQFKMGLVRAVKVSTPRGVLAMMIISPGVSVMSIGYLRNATIEESFENVLKLWRTSRKLKYPEFDGIG